MEDGEKCGSTKKSEDIEISESSRQCLQQSQGSLLLLFLLDESLLFGKKNSPGIEFNRKWTVWALLKVFPMFCLFTMSQRQ